MQTLGLTQTEVAEKCGVTKGTICRLLADKTKNPNLRTVGKLRRGMPVFGDLLDAPAPATSDAAVV